MERYGSGTHIILIEGDQYHSTENKMKMASGIALNDLDRQGWLETLKDICLRHLETDINAVIVLACSALKKSYRDVFRLKIAQKTQFILLTGSKECLAARIQGRSDHFFPPSLLDSQLNTLELPDPQTEPDVTLISTEESVEQTVERIISLIKI